MLRKQTLITGLLMCFLGGWMVFVSISNIRMIRQREINDPDGFAEFTWKSIRESVDACGNNQTCHQHWLAVELPKKMPLTYYSMTDREKVSRSITVVTSGKAAQIEPWFVQQKLGPDLYKKLRH